MDTLYTRLSFAVRGMPCYTNYKIVFMWPMLPGLANTMSHLNINDKTIKNS